MRLFLLVLATLVVGACGGGGGGNGVAVVPGHAKWTVMVYLNAASDLYAFSDQNMDQLERVAGNPEVRFVVQWKQSQTVFPSSSFDGTRRYLVRPDGGAGVRSQLVQTMGPGVDMGKPETLNQFVAWAKAEYPADRYALVMWSHGNGWRRKPEGVGTRAVSYDDETGNAIQIWQLGQALAGHRFDILAWDASLMQMIEVAYELRGLADYVAGSEESPPAEGYPYDAVFAGFAQNPNATTRNLSKGFVDAMVSAPGYAGRRISQSVVETAKLADVERAVDSLAGKLMASRATYATAYQTARAEAQSYNPTLGRYYRDLHDVCARLANLTDLDAQCNEVIAKIKAAVVWEGHNGHSPGSHGISIDMPPGSSFMPNATDYGRLRFGAAGRWDEWLVVSP